VSLTALGISDEGRRCSDIVNQHVANFDWNHWIAIRLSDGGSDGVLYDTRRDAVTHQLHETLCAYLLIPPTGISPRNAASYLATHRKIYDGGMRVVDPDREVILPHRRDLQWTIN
jgi:hypothetical protein